MGESIEERYVRELVFEKFGAVLRKIPESTVKTADFELLDGHRRVAVLELKQLELTPRTAEFGWIDAEIVIPDEYGPRDPRIRFQQRVDKGPKRLGKLIASAWKQLGNYEVPKILAFVNDERGLDIVDLQEAWNGFLHYGTGETGYLKNVASRKIANGHIRDIKGKIDLYVWFDRHYGKGTHLGFADGRKEVRTEGPQCSCSTLTGYNIARGYFGCPEMEIPEHILRPLGANPEED